MPVARVGRRDVQGEEDDRKSEGRLEHVCRCWRDEAITPWGWGLFKHPSLRST